MKHLKAPSRKMEARKLCQKSPILREPKGLIALFSYKIGFRAYTLNARNGKKL